MPKLAPPPTVAPETWGALLDAAAAFAAVKPWEFAYDSDVVGLIDPVTGETRIGCVLGAAGSIFAAVFYRRPAGLRWMLQLLNETPDVEDLNTADGMDCLKVEFVPKRELWKEDLALLKAAAFKPAGKGRIWPQFRSAEPGWHPWHINQTEADQFLPISHASPRSAGCSRNILKFSTVANLEKFPLFPLPCRIAS